jgi:hypothetical protein
MFMEQLACILELALTADERRRLQRQIAEVWGPKGRKVLLPELI